MTFTMVSYLILIPCQNLQIFFVFQLGLYDTGKDTQNMEIHDNFKALVSEGHEKTNEQIKMNIQKKLLSWL